MVSRSTIAGLAFALAALAVALRMTSGPEPGEGAPAALVPDAALGPATITVSRTGEPSVALVNRGGAWTFAPPDSGRADSSAVESMLAALARASVRDRISPRQRKVRGLDLADYGLVNPRATVSVALAGQPAQAVSFGRDAPGGGVFALSSDGGDVVVAGHEILDSVPAGAGALRSRVLVEPGPNPPYALEIRRPGEPALRLEKGGEGRWRISSPFDFPADQTAAEALLARLCGPSVRRFVRLPGTNETAAAAAAARLEHGLAPDEATASLAVWRQGSAAPETFVFGIEDPSDPGCVFAAFLQGGAIYTVDKAVADAVATPLSGLRDRRVFPFAPEDVRGFSVGGPGRTETALSRAEGGGWRFSLPVPAPSDAAEVERFLSLLLSWRDAAATPSGASPEARGTPHPDGEIRVSFDLAGSATPFSATILRESPDGATPAWTVLPSGPGAPLVLLDGHSDPSVAFAEPALAAMRDRTILALPPDAVSRVGALGDDGAPAAASAEACEAVAALATNFVAASVLSLSSPDSAAWGLLPPRAQWIVETSLPEKPVAILQLGRPLGDGTSCARIKGDAAVFAVSGEDAAVLAAAAAPDDFQTKENQP